MNDITAINKLKALYFQEKNDVKKGKLFMIILSLEDSKMEIDKENDLLGSEWEGIKYLILLPSSNINIDILKGYIDNSSIIFIMENNLSNKWIQQLKKRNILVTKLFAHDMDALIKDEAKINDLIMYKIYKSFILKQRPEDTVFNKELYNDFIRKIKSRQIHLNDCSVNKIFSSLPSEDHPRKFIKNPLVDNLSSLLENNDIILMYGKSASGKTSLALEFSYHNLNTKNIKIYYIDATLLQDQDIPGLFLDMFKELMVKEINIILIIDDLHANLSATQKLIDIINLIQKTELGSQKTEFGSIKIVGILWPEFVKEISSKFTSVVKKMEVNPEQVKERMLSRLGDLNREDKRMLINYVEDNLLLLSWIVKLFGDKKININDLSELPHYIYENIKNKVSGFDTLKLKKTLFVVSALGQYEIDITKEFINRIITNLAPSDFNKLISQKILRVKGRYFTLGHRAYCKIIFDYLAEDREIRNWLEGDLRFKSITDLILEYLYTLEPTQIWSILKKIYMYTGIKTGGNVIIDIWRDLDYLIEKIVYQQSLDSTWNKTPSSAMFAVQALCNVGYNEKAKGSIKFLRSIYSTSQNYIDVNVMRLNTAQDFRNIKNAMINQDGKERIFGERGKNIDERKFHENWVKGLILCAEAYYNELSSKELLELALYVEKDVEKDSNGNMYFYPKRVPWCTARVLIGLGLCGRNIKNSQVVKKISDWLLNHPNYSDGKWQSGTGTWNTWIETTALVIQALLSVGVSPHEKKIQSAANALYNTRDEWTKKDKEIAGVTALQAYSYARKDLTKVIKQITELAKYAKDTALWINATKPSDKTLKQSCLVSQTASGLVDVMWRYIRDDLPLLLENFDMKTSSHIQKPSVFISYSQEDKDHNDWVLNLANRLERVGYNVYLDKKDSYNKDLTHFMENAIERADFILIICTPNYKQKADERKGGVGYEARIISYEIYSGALNKGKIFIPILRKGNSESAIPNYLKGYEYIDFSDDNKFEQKLKELIKRIKRR